jgi:predicted transcriptional regulator
MSTHRELLPVELLVRDDQRVDEPTRRVSVAEHQQFQKHIAASLADQQPADEIDDALADPVLDHLPSYQSKKKTARVLSILDQLNKEGHK